MSDATSIPILLDGDTGYGNFNNARRLVKKLEQRNIAGVCIEDKIFPKTNSFIKGEEQPLADIDEFCGKIKAMKDSQSDDEFVVISRVEAFIAGWGLQEALKRAEAYREAGTDAILIHSKRPDMAEIEAFIKEWGGRHPLVIVPTKYYPEKIYLGSSEKNMNSIILVTELGQHAILTDQIRQLKTFGIKDINKIEVLEGNQQNIETGDVYSLYMARDKIRENTIISNSKITCKEYMLDELTKEITTSRSSSIPIMNGKETKNILLKEKSEMTDKPLTDQTHGEFIGLWRVSGEGAKVLKNVLEELAYRKDFKQLSLIDLFNHIQSIHPIAIKYMKGSWLDLHTFTKIQKDGDTND